MLQRRTLAILGLLLVLGGQYLLDSHWEAGILLLGAALITTLLERWIYLSPLSRNWVGPLLLLLFGYSYRQEPLGWFFIAWAVILIGTGLRADRYIQAYLSRLRAEEERRERLAAMGFPSSSDEEE